MKKETIQYWNRSVRPLAQAATDREICNLISKGENEQDLGKKDDIEDELKVLASEIKDLVGMWYVGSMIDHVERNLAEGRIKLGGLNSINQIIGTLNSESYWKNVWGIEGGKPNIEDIENNLPIKSKKYKDEAIALIKLVNDLKKWVKMGLT
jgi:hypothetical protein